MAHIVILGKNAELTKRIADANLELAEAGELWHEMPDEDVRKATVEGKFRDLESMLDGFCSAYDALVNEINADCL